MMKGGYISLKRRRNKWIRNAKNIYHVFIVNGITWIIMDCYDVLKIR